LFHAKRAIRDENTVIVVEGYMDVVALAQSGVENAVATLGTATTPMHVEKLLRLADNLVFCFDGDKAGQRAAWRALEQSLPVVQDGKEVRFLFLPAEDDPDTFVRRLGKEAFLAEVKRAKPLSVFLLDELRSQVDPSSDEGRARLMTLAKPLIGQVTAPALALMLRRKLADEIGLSAIEIERVVPLSAQIGNLSNASGNQGRQHGQASGQPGRGDSVDWGKPKFDKSQFRKRGPEAGAPAPRMKLPAATRPVLAISRMLVRPKLANVFDLSVEADDETALGAAFRVATYIRDHDGEGINQAMIVEHFRPTSDWIFVNQASLLLSEVDIDRLDLDTEFAETLARLRADAAAAAKKAHEIQLGRERGLI
jgi:DNA primase